MSSIKKVLFPVDLSESSPKIVPMIKEMVELLQAELHILFVARAFEHYAGLGVAIPYIHDFEAELTKQAERGLVEFLETHFQGMKYVSAVLPGDPAEKILDYAKNEGIGMIIMGTHGRKGIERIIFGSVAEFVVKYSRVPVLTIKPNWEESRA
jgi:nucleotide-binding universal stress UspA family protein